MRMAKYTIQAINDLHVIITDDQDPSFLSVTNSAAQVLEDLNSRVGGLGTRRVFYRDTIMRYDELQHTAGRFKGFAACGPGQQEFLKTIE
jgi:cell division protein ZapA (FtsZ GTPase activity inhibitor)